MSVVIATRDREEYIERCVEALFSQALSPSEYEIVIVDDGSSDRTAERVADVSRHAPCKLRYIRLAESQGPARARNAGIGAAQGRIVAFTDDDCRPDPKWLEAGVQFLESGFDLVSGRTLPEPRGAQTAGDFDYAMMVPGPDPRYSTCNMFYRREVLEQVGGFRDVFVSSSGDHFGEDTDLAWRAIETGARAGFCRDALVFHAVRARGFREYLRSRRRLEGLVPLVKRYPAVRSAHFSYYFYSWTHLFAYLGLVGTVLSLLSVYGLAMWAPYFGWRLREKRNLVLNPLRFISRNRNIFGFAAADLYECWILAAASLRHRHLYV